MAITWNPQKFTEGAVVAGCLIVWFVWQLLMTAAVFTASCTKSGCGGPEYVALSAKAQGVVTAVSLLLLGPLIWRAAQRTARGEYGKRVSATGLVLGIMAIAGAWLFEIDRALECCGYANNFLPAWRVMPLLGGTAILGTLAAGLLAVTYAMADDKMRPGAPSGNQSDIEP